MKRLVFLNILLSVVLYCGAYPAKATFTKADSYEFRNVYYVEPKVRVVMTPDSLASVLFYMEYPKLDSIMAFRYSIDSKNNSVALTGIMTFRCDTEKNVYKPKGHIPPESRIEHINGQLHITVGESQPIPIEEGPSTKYNLVHVNDFITQYLLQPSVTSESEPRDMTGTVADSYILLLMLIPLLISIVLAFSCQGGKIAENFDKKVKWIGFTQFLTFLIVGVNFAFNGLAMIPTVIAYGCLTVLSPFNIFFTWFVLDEMKEKHCVKYPFVPIFVSFFTAMVIVVIVAMLCKLLGFNVNTVACGVTLTVFLFAIFAFMMRRYLKKQAPRYIRLFPALFVMMLMTFVAVWTLIVLVIIFFVFTTTGRQFLTSSTETPTSLQKYGRSCGSCANAVWNCPFNEPTGLSPTHSPCSNYTPSSY